MTVKPLEKHLGPLGHPEEGGTSRSEAAANADALKRMRDSKGWEVFLGLIESQLRHDQKTMMSPATTKDDVADFNRRIGEWAGLRDAPKLVEGAIRYGERAAREMEDTKAA